MKESTKMELRASYAKYSDAALSPRVLNLLKLRRRLKFDRIDHCRKTQKYLVLTGLIEDTTQELLIVLEEIERRLPKQVAPPPF